MIARLELHNFRSHEHTRLDFDHQIVWCIGPNAAGKSSLYYGLQMGLTGQCPVVDGKGSGKELLIRSGEKDYDIRIELRDGRVVERTSKRVVGFGQTQVREYQQALARELAPPAVLHVLLGGTYFELDEKTQRDLLLGLSGATATDEELREFCTQQLGELSVAQGVKELLAGLRAELIDKHITEVYALRRDSKASLKAEQGKAGLSIELDFDADAQRAFGEELRELVRSLTVAQGKAISEDSGLFTRLKALEQREKAISEALAKLKPAKDPAATLEAGEKRVQAAQAAIDEAQAELEQIKARQTLVLNLRNAAVADTGKCKFCNRPWDEASLAEAVANLDETETQLAARRAVVQEAYEKATSEKGLAVTRLGELRQVTSGTEELAQIAKQREKLTEAKRASEAELAEVNRKLVEANEAEREWMEAYGARLRDAGAAQGAKENLTRLTGRVAALEALYKALEQFKQQRVRGRIADFVGEVNKHAKSFGLTYILDPDTLVLKTREGLLYRQLSESERMRMDVCWRLSIAKLTGLRFIVVDRADVLDNTGRQHLLQTLLTSGCSALVLVKLDGTFNPPPMKKVKWMKVGKNEAGCTVIEQVL